jgi:hypothetical protein
MSLEPFREGLRELEYIEGLNVILEVRWTDGQQERLPAVVRKHLRLKVDVIVTHSARQRPPRPGSRSSSPSQQKW